MKKDILLIMSDQHNGKYVSMSDGMNDITPHLHTISQQGTHFPNTYCNAPLCVPSRMSFLSGTLPSENGVLDNNSTLNSDCVTLAHKMSLAGYKTILIGRMHFKGVDQFHGFDERYLGDITTQYWGQSREDLKDYYPGFKASSAQSVVGYGDSPVLDFDHAVYQKTLEILNREHEKPLFVIVGFYAPHFPYISKEKPTQFDSIMKQFDLNLSCVREYESLTQATKLTRIQTIDRIYQTMIYEIDAYVGDLFKKFKKREGLFIYTSDHGDQVGKRHLFGKKTLYEDATRIPLVIHGVAVEGDVTQEFSLLDLHKLLVGFAKTQSLVLEKSIVKIQSVIDDKAGHFWTEAVVKNRMKLMRINAAYYLYDLVSDRDETQDISSESAKTFNELRTYLESDQSVKRIMTYYNDKQKTNRILMEHGKNLNINPAYKQAVIDEYKVPKDLNFFGYEED